MPKRKITVVYILTQKYSITHILLNTPISWIYIYIYNFNSFCAQHFVEYNNSFYSPEYGMSPVLCMVNSEKWKYHQWTCDRHIRMFFFSLFILISNRIFWLLASSSNPSSSSFCNLWYPFEDIESTMRTTLGLSLLTWLYSLIYTNKRKIKAT